MTTTDLKELLDYIMKNNSWKEMRIKIINLLNLVYKKEAPKRVLYKYCEYEFDKEANDYINKDGLYLFAYLFTNEEQALFLEIEILEDKPKFEINENGYIHTNNGAWKGRKMDIEFAKTLNYLIENCVPFGKEENSKMNNYIKSISVKSDNIFDFYESDDSNE